MEEIPDLVVLAGPNGTGKSTVLEAIAQWKEVIAPYYTARNAGPDAVSQGAERGEISITMTLTNDEVAFCRRELEARGQPVGDVDISRISGNVVIAPDGTVSGRATQAIHGGMLELVREVNLSRPLGIMEYIGPYRRLPAAQIQAIPLSPITPDRERQTRLYAVDSKFDEVKQYLLALQVQDWERHYQGWGGDDPMRQIRQLFEVFFSPKRFIGARTVDSPQGPVLKLLVETPAGNHDIDNLSSGEKEILMVFATLQRLRLSNSVLLYDEPELHLNAALERKVIPELSSLGKGNQIWVTTHSIEMIDSTPIENLFIMSHYERGNQVRKAENNREQIELFKSLGASTGVQLVSERVVFVEGEDTSADKEILEEVFADYRHQVSFVPAGGASALEWVGRSGVEVWQRASRHGQFFLVRDRDFLSDEQVDNLEKELRGRVWVWSRYHIENFLLEGEAILRALRRAGIHLFGTAEEVEVELKRLADTLRDETVARWVGTDLNETLGWQDFRITGGGDPIGQLEAKAKAASERTWMKLQSGQVAKLVNQKQAALMAWDDSLWRKFVPGKRLLREFVGGLGGGLAYEQLRSLVLAEMKDDRNRAAEEGGRKLFPEEFERLAQAVLQGLD